MIRFRMHGCIRASMRLTAAKALMPPVLGWTSAAGAASSSSLLESELPVAEVGAATLAELDRSASSSCCRRARRDIAAVNGIMVFVSEEERGVPPVVCSGHDLFFSLPPCNVIVVDHPKQERSNIITTR